MSSAATDPDRRRPPDRAMVSGRVVGDPLRLISMDETARRVMFSKVHVYRLIAAGKFPRPVKIGDARIAFVESEVDEFIRARIAQRDEIGMEANA
jgi:prophage regulatory protein